MTTLSATSLIVADATRFSLSRVNLNLKISLAGAVGP